MDNRNSIITTNEYLDNAPESMPGHDHAKKHVGEEVPVVKRKGCFAITSIKKVPNNDSSSEESSDDDDGVSRPTAALTVSPLARGCGPTPSEKLSPVVSAGVSQPDAPKECRFKIVELHPKKPVKAAAAQKTYTRGRWGVIDSFSTIGSKPSASATSTPIAPVHLSPNNGTTTPSLSPASKSLPVSSPQPPATASSTPSTSTSRFRIVTLYEDKTAKKPAAKPAAAAGPYKKGRWTVADSFSAPTQNSSVDSPSAGGIAAQICTNTPKAKAAPGPAKAAPGPAKVATGLKLELKSTSSGAGDTQHCPVVRETDKAAPSLTIQVTSPQQIQLPASLSQDNASKSRRPRQEPTEAPTTPAVPSPAAAQRPTVVSEPSLAVEKTKPASAKAAASKRSSTICITSVRRTNSILRRPKLATIREMEEPQEVEPDKSQSQTLFVKIVEEQFAIYASLHDRI